MPDDFFSASDGFLTGWQNIATFMGVSVQTAKRYKRKYGMPVRYFPGGRPWALAAEITLWAITFDELMKKNKQDKQNG